MKNGSISDQLKMQEREIKETAKKQDTQQNTVSSEKEKKRTVNPPKEKAQTRTKKIKRKKQ